MKYCPNCKQQLSDEAKFCPECGTRTGGFAAVSPAEEKPKSAFKTVLIILLIIAAVLAAIAVTSFVFSAKTGPADDAGKISEAEKIEPVSPADTEQSPASAEEKNSEAQKPGQAPVPQQGPLDSGSPAQQFSSVVDNLWNGAAVPFETESAKEGPEIDTELDVSFDVKDAPFLVNSSKAKIKLLVDSEGESVIDLDIKIGGFFGISGVMTRVDDTLGIEVFGKYYTVTLEELAKMIAEEAGVPAEELNISGSAFNSRAAALEAAGAFRIVKSLANEGNTTRSDGTFNLEYAGASVDGAALTCRPSAAETEKFITEICTYLLNTDYIGRFEDLAQSLEEMRDGAHSTAQRLEKQNFECTLICDNSRIYAVYAGTDEEKLVYESVHGENGGKAVALVQQAEKSGKSSALIKDSEKGGMSENPGFVFEYTVENGRIKGSAVFGDSYATVKFNLSLTEKSALGVPYGDFDITFDTVRISLSTDAGEKGGSMHTLAVSEADEGELVRVYIASSDKASGAQLPDIPATEVNSENFDEVLGELDSILEMFN